MTRSNSSVEISHVRNPVIGLRSPRRIIDRNVEVGIPIISVTSFRRYARLSRALGN